VIEEMIQSLGLEKERFRLVWCSSAEADRFMAAMREMNDLILSLGPSPFRTDVEGNMEGRGVALCR
jgi:F420-non-reducing hydrogenase iron-sulfur subunit